MVIEKIAKLFLNVVGLFLFLLFVLYYCASSFTHIKRPRYLKLLRLDKLEHYLHRAGKIAFVLYHLLLVISSE